jgi:hypothetical protein
MSNSKLFSEPEDENQNKLVWIGSSSNDTKAQKEFNDALAKHKAVIKQAQEIDVLVNFANAEYAKQIFPELENKKKLVGEHTQVLCGIYIDEPVKLSKNQREKLKLIILDICSQEIEDDRELYYNIVLQLETTAERNQRLAEKKRIEKQIKNQFGFDVDLEDLNRTSFDSEEEKQAHKEKYKEFFEKHREQESKEFEDYFNRKKKKEKPKTKAQLDKESKLAEAEKLLNTDINKLFKDLAKLIHPDREQDTELRVKKENLMKELSNARDNSDIADILRIKMLVDDLLPNNTTELSLNDSSIKRFVGIIKSKITELEKTIKQKAHNFPFRLLLNPKTLNNKIINEHINREVTSIKYDCKHIQTQINVLSDTPKYIKDFIREYTFADDFDFPF